jgi:hypothetical protein
MRDVVRLVAARPLLLSSRLLLLGACLLAPAFLLLSGWGRRKPSRRTTATGVLLVEAADRLRARLRTLLERDGYHVLEAADETAGFDVLHGSPHPLVAVLDAGQVPLLQRVVADRRLCAHHAYVVLCTWRRPTVSVSDSVRAQLTLFVVRGPSRWRALRRAVERAAGALPSDPLYPASPSS